MTTFQTELYNRILSFEINGPNSPFNFTHRLARENGWSMEYSARVQLEYKRFIFLIVATGESMSPYDEVDQVWHPT